MKFWTTKKFKRLEVSWNKKLAKSGFIDLEETVGSLRQLKKDEGCGGDIFSRGDYYYQLERRVEASQFDSKIEEFVMRKAATGLRIFEIVRELEKRRTKRHRKTVRHIIRRYEDRWGIRKWNKQTTK